VEEARAVNSIRHPNIVDITDFGEVDGRPYYVMELLDGETLSARIQRIGKLEPADAVAVGAQVASALAAAHDHGVVHRDLKPDNVMLLDSYGERDYVKVLDFGIARSLTARESSVQTRTGALLGTPAYMSPEQCEGRAVDVRSDLYSLGIVLYELALGEPPFSLTHTLPQLLMDHVAQPPPDIRARVPGINEPVAELIMALLRKSPDERPQSAEAVVAALAPWAQATPQGPISPRTSADAPVVAKTMAIPELQPAQPSIALEPLPRSWKAIPLVALALLVAGGASWFVYKRTTSASPEAVATAMTLPGEPPFPVACVSQRGRNAVLAAATGKAPWSRVPENASERRLAEARAAKEGTPAAAPPRLEALVAACPTSAVAHTLLGKALARADRDAAAMAQFKAALDLAPSYLVAKFDMAVALMKQGQAAAVLPLASAVLSQDPRHQGALLLRGQARMAGGDARGAVDDLKAYTTANPQSGPVWALLGEALAKAGDGEASRDAFCQAVELGEERVQSRCPPARW
jgi:Flp pilus assembly protein TadD